MPRIPRIIIRPTRTINGLKKTSPVFLCLILAIALSGCSVIGQTNRAALQVTTNPQASVFLDNKHIGKTPFFSDQLQEGIYTIKVSASDATYIDKIELKNGALTVVNRDLNNNFLAQSGEILWLTDGAKNVAITTNPPDSNVEIDGQYRGKSPILVDDLEIGDHKVSVTKSGYLTREYTIKNSNNYTLVSSVTLASQAAKNPTSQTETTQVEKVEILNTPQGFLRVRKDPELTSQEIGQVESGSTYEVVQETDNWIKISFDGKLGWVSAQFTKKI